VNVFGEPSAALLSRSAFADRGFNCTMIQLCDLEFFARTASRGGLAFVDAELATFRVHGKSTSSSNLASRQFRKEVLDTLILLHEYAFDPTFADLRDAGRAARPPVDFATLTARELFRAMRDAAGDADRRAALREVVGLYPKLARPWWRLWHRVRKTLGSRA
jgi:hypothetical protein